MIIKKNFDSPLIKIKKKLLLVKGFKFMVKMPDFGYAPDDPKARSK